MTDAGELLLPHCGSVWSNFCFLTQTVYLLIPYQFAIPCFV